MITFGDSILKGQSQCGTGRGLVGMMMIKFAFLVTYILMVGFLQVILRDSLLLETPSSSP